jgi:thiamine pyrophosphokinase
MSQGKLQSFQQKALSTSTVVLIGPLTDSLPSSLPSAAYLGVDGGASRQTPHGFDLTLGDQDSLTSDVTLDLLFPQSKDQSDLALALAHLPSAPLNLHLVGFIGGRLDHELMNLGELSRHLELNGGSIILYQQTSPRLLGLAAGTHTLKIKGVFSLLALSDTLFSIKGQCEFPLAPTMTPALSSRLLSNMAHGEVILSADRPFFCYLGDA